MQQLRIAVRHLRRAQSAERHRHHAQPANRRHRSGRPPREGPQRQFLDAGRTRCRPHRGPRSHALTRSSRRRSPLTRAERQLIDRLRTPLAVQQWLNALPYNTEKAARRCAAFAASSAPARRTASRRRCRRRRSSSSTATRRSSSASSRSTCSITSSSSIARRTGWGSVARSRDPGLHGRKPLFATPRALALSYVESYVDFTGGIKAYAVVDLRVLGELRLAAVREERLEGRADAARLAASAAGPLAREDRRDAAAVSPRFARRTATSRGSTTRAASDGRRCRREFARRG